MGDTAMGRDNLYEEHLAEMFGNKVIDEYSDTEILRVLKRLLSCLPNDGKLYKYRPIVGDTFDYAYDALKNGYVWLSTADRFNDDEDCVLFYDPESEAKELETYIVSHPEVIAGYLIRQTELAGTDVFDCTSDVLDCFDKQTGRIKKKKALSYFVKRGYDREKSKEYINAIQKLIDDTIKTHSPMIEKIVDNYLHFNELNRAQSYVYSLSETCDADTMWAHYADSNKGFCIEYDFSKALLLPTEVQRLLISTYKIIYKEEREAFSFIHILDYVLRGQQDTAEFQEVNYEMLIKMITKRIDWQYEKEWRIFLNNVEHKLQADLVSGIILDERIMNTENAHKLISLANERGWKITVRKKNLVQTKHQYIPYEEWEQRRQTNA